MSQYAYILVVISLVFLFLLNKYEKERLQKLYQEQLLKDETFRSDIKEKIHTTENINDVIAYINKTYHLGMLLSKDITDQLNNQKPRRKLLGFLGHNFYLPTIANNIYIKNFIGNFHLCYRGGYNKFFLLMIERLVSA